jgi:hypothetical protein
MCFGLQLSFVCLLCAGHSACYVAHLHSMLVFGGYTADAFSSEVWLLNLTTLKWTLQATQGAAKPTVSVCCAVLCSVVPS